MKRAEKMPLLRLCFDAAALCAALALSYLENLIPIGMILPLPGIKPGLANLVITLVFCIISPADAAVISLGRVLISGLLFGTPLSMLISLTGALAAYAGLCFACLIGPVSRNVSFIGISVLCAALHSAGQLAAVMVISGSGVLYYLPLMLFASCLTGGVNGIILNLIYPRIFPLVKRYKIKR